VAGFIHALLGRGHLPLDPERDLEPSPTAASYARALYAALWAFDGFNQANYVAGEMQNPERDLPRAVHASMGLVAVRFGFPLDPYTSGLMYPDLVHPCKRGVFLRPR